MALTLPHSRTLIVTTKRGTKSTIQVRHKKPIYHKHPEPKTEEERNLTELNNLFKPNSNEIVSEATEEAMEDIEFSQALEASLQQFNKRKRNRHHNQRHEPNWE